MDRKVTISDLKKVFENFYLTKGNNDFAELLSDDAKLLASDLQHDLHFDDTDEIMLSLECELMLGIHIDMTSTTKFTDDTTPHTVARLLAMCNNEL